MTTSGNGARPLEDLVLGIVRSYPPSLRRWVDIATITRVFSRDLMLTLVDAHGATADNRHVLWDEFVALPFVERRPNETFALHETTRRPLLADLKRRDRNFVSAVASSAFDYFLPRANSDDGHWSDMLEAVYYRLLMDSEGAIEAIDQFLDGPMVSGYPARKSAVIAVAAELVDAGLLEGEAPRWTRAWQLEELTDSGQWDKTVRIAGSELGADADGFVIRDDIDARIATALGIAHAELGDTGAALSLYERVIASGSLWAPTAQLYAGDVHARQHQYAEAEESYFVALEHLVRRRMVDVEGNVSASGSLRTRQMTAWHMRQFDLTLATDRDDGSNPAADGEPDEPEDEPGSISLVFIDGDEGGAGDDAIDLVELEDGRFGAVIEPNAGLSMLLSRLADVYVSSGRLDEAHSAAAASSAIAEVIGDNDGMSRAYDIMARIGMQRGDPEFLRMAKSANRELSEMAAQTGDPPSRLRASLRLGWSEVSDGHPGRATAAFYEAKRLASELGDRVSLASSLLGVAEAASQDERTDDASAALLAAIAEYESLEDVASAASTRHQLGDLYVTAGQPEPASEMLEAARLLFAQRSDLAGEAGVRESMARAASLVGDYVMADEQLGLARSLARRHGDPRMTASVELTAGALLEERYEFAAAIDAYRKALALAGDQYPDLRALCHRNLGDAEFSSDYHRAVDEYSKAAKLYNQIGDTVRELRARAALVIALSMLRDESAIDLADELVASLPLDLDHDTRSSVHLARARALMELGRHSEALRMLSDPDTAELGMGPAVMRLDLLATIGRFAEVVAEIDPLLERDPYRADLYSLKGWSLLHLDPAAAAAAEAACGRARELEPDNPWYQKDLASCLLILQKPKEAFALASRVIARLSRPDIESLSTDILKLLGFCLYQVGDYSRARKHLAAAIERDADDAVSDLDLALVEMCARSGGAEDHYSRMLDKLAAVNPERRQGILAVALRDVENAVRWGRVDDPTVAGRIADRIRSALPAVS